MAGKLIIIEGGDGCGKATQTDRLFARLAGENRPVRQISFPDYQSPSSALIKMYLAGRFGGRPQDVNAYAASTFFAVDRYASFKTSWGSWYEEGCIILADRYVTSNMVHQMVKITDVRERETFLDWLWDLEYVKFGLPVPDKVLLLDVPPACSEALLTGRTAKDGTDNKDIHEQDAAYLVRCHESYRAAAIRYGWQIVNCMDGSALRGIDDIHDEIFQAVQDIL